MGETQVKASGGDRTGTALRTDKAGNVQVRWDDAPDERHHWHGVVTAHPGLIVVTPQPLF